VVSWQGPRGAPVEGRCGRPPGCRPPGSRRLLAGAGLVVGRCRLLCAARLLGGLGGRRPLRGRPSCRVSGHHLQRNTKEV